MTRRMWSRLAGSALILSLSSIAAPPAGAGEKTVIIDGVDRYRVMEPLFECVRVALSHRGEKYSPAYIQGISGAAFRIAGPCPCSPTCSAAMETPDLVRLFGYEGEQLALVGKGADQARDVGKLVARVKDEVRAGRAVIVWHAFTNAEWDVVCGFDEDRKQFLGRGSYKGLDHYAREDETRPAKCDVCSPLGAILIGGKTGSFDARQAELAALEEAVRHARSPRDRFLAEAAGRKPAWRFRSGVACYEWWAQRFRDDPNHVPDAGDRYPLGVYRSTHRAAAAFLREIAPKYPEAREHLEQAAKHFAADADALDVCHDQLTRGWEGWQKPDSALAARMAEQLARAGDAYGRGIAEIERAMVKIDPDAARSAQQPRLVRREDGRVWVGGIRKLSFGDGGQCTFTGALAEALAATRQPYTYQDLMGLSALAFRVRWCNEQTKTKWCPSCAVGEMPDEQAALARLTGWTLSGEWLDPAQRDNDRLRERIVASIGAGKPVLAYPPAWNMGVIYGYEDAGRTLLISDYKADAMPSSVPIEKLGPLFTFLGEYRQPPPLREALLDSLRTAVRNWKRDRHDGGIAGREYFYGDAAHAAWMEDLRGFDRLPEEARAALMELDPWVYLSLHNARGAAAGFLGEWSVVLDGESQAAARSAAALYEQQVKCLDRLVAGKRAPVKDQDWSKTARRRYVEVLAEARKVDAAAIAEIEKALAAASKGREELGAGFARK